MLLEKITFAFIHALEMKLKLYNIEHLGCKVCGKVRKNVKVVWNPADFPDRNPCICSNPPNPFYRFFPCQNNVEHDAWRPRSQEECPTCENELFIKRKANPVRILGVKEDGKPIKLADDSGIIPPNPYELIQRSMDEQKKEKQEQKEREIKIVSLLERIANRLEPMEEPELKYQ